jgi:NADH-quinone oxidoreductase subunit L
MTIPLVILSVFAIALGFVGTPFWPWFHAYLTGHLAHLHWSSHLGQGTILTMLLSSLLVAAGMGLAWWLYGRNPGACDARQDILEVASPDLFLLLRRKFFVDELYDSTVVKFSCGCARACDWLDRCILHGAVLAVAWVTVGLSWLGRMIDEWVVNLGFDKGCASLRASGQGLSFWQNGRVQCYLRSIALALAALSLIFIWGCRP